MSLGAISPNYQRPLRDRAVLPERQLLEIGTDQEKMRHYNPYAFQKLLVPGSHARIQDAQAGVGIQQSQDAQAGLHIFSQTTLSGFLASM